MVVVIFIVNEKWMDSVRGKEREGGSWGNWEYRQIKTNRDY